VILHVTRPHERTKDVVTRRVFESPNTFGGRAPHGPAGGVSALPQALQPQSGRGPTSKEKGGKGEMGGEKREGRGLPPLYLTSAYGPVPVINPHVCLNIE